VFILIPLAAGLSDSEEMRERYFDMVMGRLERHTNQSGAIWPAICTVKDNHISVWLKSQMRFDLPAVQSGLSCLFLA
jgi:hypothetical protein